jgi:hypothetical protein
MATRCELAQRTTIRAFRSGPKVLIIAEGELPSPGCDAKIMLRPEDIFPPWYEVLRCSRPGSFPQIIVPYRVSLTIEYPEDQETVTVFHADGEDKVTIEACGEELSAYGAVVGGGACPEEADQSIGFSKKLSFDEAFADAIAKLPQITPEHPDMLETVRVAEIGELFGGIASFHELYVRVWRSHDSAPPPETEQDGVALLADPRIVAAGGSLEVTVDNGSDQTVTYGLFYTIERWDGKTWQKTDLAPTIFPEILLVTPPGAGQPQSIMLPADIERGFYRVAKSVTGQETGKILELYAQFEVR